MRIGIVTDSCCDLPRAFLDRHQIEILPITIRSGETTFIDKRDPKATQQFYKSLGDAEYLSEPFSVDAISQRFLERLVVEFDYVFCLTVMSSRSKIFDNATQAARAILTDYRPIREAAGHTRPFSLRVFDSQNLFVGQGLIVAEAARLAEQDATTSAIIARIEQLSHCTQAFLIPSDLSQLRNNARRKGDKSVGLASYLLGSALDIKPVIRGFQGDTHPVAKVRGFEAGVNKLFNLAIKLIEGKHLLSSIVTVSFGGDPAEVAQLPGYVDLVACAARHGVDVLVSEMSVTAGVNIGAGGLALAFAAEHEIPFD
ncbi:EDD domain protein, DegV family [Andreprevotia lacus DSM 23236]|jgi:DegV family protein with EDD domain|uniref:EDD domain protein, DegV family n=1 Tax=Andreprevotia lacus DSM 23236 TaxID=1121001 RepID=A0A1W1WW67_9NEIS|nr:DegV family protein [Andreprevotia lacus]SMC15959.1 EDD domain protein, DegV family [Andreprevotia lacus DSM 23236]